MKLNSFKTWPMTKLFAVALCSINEKKLKNRKEINKFN